MCYKVLITFSLLSMSLAWGVSPVQATPIPLIDAAGHDSGWTVESGAAALDLLPANIIDVDLDPAAKSVIITVAKDFGPYEDLFGTIIFPVGVLTFTEVNANADLIDKIIILSESAVNNTGVAWDSFSWQVSPSGAAEFNVGESSGWSEPSFSSWALTSHQLLASGGSVPNGATFAPSSNLVIDIHLDSSDSALSFSLKQHVTPEPATLILLAVGLPLLLKRRRNRS